MFFENIFKHEQECYGCEHCHFKHGFVKCDLDKNEDEEYVQSETLEERKNHYCIKRNMR